MMKELSNFYPLPDVIRLRSMRWAGHVACKGEKKKKEGVIQGFGMRTLKRI
jgi:hypothetical protein